MSAGPTGDVHHLHVRERRDALWGELVPRGAVAQAPTPGGSGGRDRIGAGGWWQQLRGRGRPVAAVG